ncbi:class I SAM-dependent methyltransferase [Bacillus sp. JCM 19041]|uniref:class I SAM-dependent methyltransferase n=1 Tax=Bacillus sp. JCM 19041 TaxID=1460637 RepID=UPI0006CF8447
MSINFHDSNHARYATREADGEWTTFIKQLIDYQSIDLAVDIACGGGIYTKALINAGAKKAIGIDFSDAMLKSANQNNGDQQQVQFLKGEAAQVPLPTHSVDLILERALIHHLSDYSPAFQEAHRLIRNGGTFLIQDRIADDCFLPGSSTHVRGYFFERFPHLVDIEKNRRPHHDTVVQALKNVGFTQITSHTIWENRKEYPSKADLLIDIQNRIGRSLLHELSDAELSDSLTL